MNVHGRKRDFENSDNPIQEIWNQRGRENTEDLPDFNQKQLEVYNILRFIKPDMDVLDVGCGNGKVSYEISKIAKSVKGVDFADNIIQKTKSLTNENLSYAHGDVTNLQFDNETFDLVLSQRVLINMKSIEHIGIAVDEIRRVLKKDGKYLMLETSNQGIKSLSEYRKKFGLSEIKVPWHNIPIDEDWLANYINKKFKLIDAVHFGTYFFISRIIHPLMVMPKEPSFNAKINQVALEISKVLPDFNNKMSQIVLWVLKKI